MDIETTKPPKLDDVIPPWEVADEQVVIKTYRKGLKWFEISSWVIGVMLFMSIILKILAECYEKFWRASDLFGQAYILLGLLWFPFSFYSLSRNPCPNCGLRHKFGGVILIKHPGARGLCRNCGVKLWPHFWERVDGALEQRFKTMPIIFIHIKSHCESCLKVIEKNRSDFRKTFFH